MFCNEPIDLAAGLHASDIDSVEHELGKLRLTVAAKTVQAFQDKVSRLYEQNGGSVGVPGSG